MTGFLNPTTETAGRFSPVARGILLGLLLVAGVLTRGWHVATEFEHPDEPITTGVSRSLEKTWDTNWRLAELPLVHRYDQYNFSTYLYAVHGWAKVVAPVLPAAWTQERESVVGLRTFSILCGALVVVWAYLLGERLCNPVTGGAAALLVLTNPQLLADGHYARPEAMLTWLTLLTVWLAVREDWNWRGRLAATSLLVGLMIATKVTMGLLLVAPGWIAWRASREFTGVQRFWRFDLALLAAAGLVVSGFALGAPGAVLHPQAFFHGVAMLAEQYGGFHEPHSEFGGSRIWAAQAKYFFYTEGVVALLLGFLAVVGSWRRREWPVLLLCVAPTLAYYAYFSTKMVFFERNLSHVLPLGLVVVAVGVCWAGEKITAAQTGWRWIGPVVALALAAAPGAVISARLLGSAFSDEVLREYRHHQQLMKEKYAALEWRPINLLFRHDLEKLRKDFSREQPPLLVQFSDFNDSYSRHYRQRLEQEFVTEVAGVFEKPLSRVPCSALNVYHGHRVVYLLIVARQQPPVSAR